MKAVQAFYSSDCFDSHLSIFILFFRLGEAKMGNNKTVIIGVCSILLLAMAVAVTISVTHKNIDDASRKDEISKSMKAIKAICQPTDYRQTCEKSLTSEAGNTSDPSELIKAAFKVADKEIRGALKKSETLQKAAKDPSTKDAFKICEEVLDDAMDDLHRSLDKFNLSDISRWDDYAYDLKIWLSGTVTSQETCLDGFENTTGDTGEKMKKLLQKSRELTVNALVMINEFSKAFTEVSGSSRRLLSDLSDQVTTSNEDADFGKRKLLQMATLKPDVVVAQDGSGKYRTINEALLDVPLKSPKKFVIYIKAGVYAEYIHILKKMTNVVFVGDGPTKTKITGNKSVVHSGLKTFHTATVGVDGFGFMAKDIGFENTAGHSGHQAVAIRVTSDQSVFYNCQFDGYQDTLYAHDHRQFYRDCTISGTVDFIFGDAAAVFQNCKIIIRKPGDNQACMVTAQGRKVEHEPTGFVLQNCVVTAEPDYLTATVPIKSYLGRPWKDFAKTIVLNSDIEAVIQPQGWEPWPPNMYIDTCWYAEFGNKGPAADLSTRVKWPGFKHVPTIEEAKKFTPGEFLRGDDWIPASGVPYVSGMMPTIKMQST